MPETAPLDVNEPAVGYELDSVTLRNIASVRYVRHHKWLDHLLGSPVATSSFVPPTVGSSLDAAVLEQKIKAAEAEVAVLDAEKKAGWKFNVDDEKSKVLTGATQKLRQDFGEQCVAQCKADVEQKLKVKIVASSPLSPVAITYDRKKVDLENAIKSKATREADPTTVSESVGEQVGDQVSEKLNEVTEPKPMEVPTEVSTEVQEESVKVDEQHISGPEPTGLSALNSPVGFPGDVSMSGMEDADMGDSYV